MDVCALERKDISYDPSKPSASRARVPDAAGGEGISIRSYTYFKLNENATMNSETTSFSFFFKPTCLSWRCLALNWFGRINIWYYQNGTFKADVFTNEYPIDMMLLQKSDESHKDMMLPQESSESHKNEDEPGKSDKIGKIGLKLSIIGPSRNKDQNRYQGHLEGFFRIGIKYDATVNPPILTIYLDGIPTSVNGSWPGISTVYDNIVFMELGTVTCFHYSEKVENEEFFETGNLQECSEYLYQ